MRAAGYDVREQDRSQACRIESFLILCIAEAGLGVVLGIWIAR
jgi:hypothetical protein